jgi:hypothetical protein
MIDNILPSVVLIFLAISFSSSNLSQVQAAETSKTTNGLADALQTSDNPNVIHATSKLKLQAHKNSKIFLESKEYKSGSFNPWEEKVKSPTESTASKYEGFSKKKLVVKDQKTGAKVEDKLKISNPWSP